MQVRVEPITVTEIATPLLVVNLFDGVEVPGGATGAVDRAIGGLISRLAGRREINTDLGQVTVIYNMGQFPALVLRGANSDLLSADTLEAMVERHPNLRTVTVPGQGNAPLLNETETVETIGMFLAANDDHLEA